MKESGLIGLSVLDGPRGISCSSRSYQTGGRRMTRCDSLGWLSGFGLSLAVVGGIATALQLTEPSSFGLYFGLISSGLGALTSGLLLQTDESCYRTLNKWSFGINLAMVAFHLLFWATWSGSKHSSRRAALQPYVQPGTRGSVQGGLSYQGVF